jgi:hypothetical protein
MPGKVVESKLFKKYGAKIAEGIKAGSKSELKTSGRRNLPPGIDGVAELTECGFFESDNEDYAGEFYWRAAGVLLWPESVSYNNAQVPVAGAQISQVVMCCDVKNDKGEVIEGRSRAANFQKIAEELRKLGYKFPDNIEGLDPLSTCMTLEAAAEQVKKNKPKFRFVTSLGKASKKNDPKTGKPYPPRIWENWNGVEGVDRFKIGASPNGQVEDNSGDQGEPPPGEETAPTETSAEDVVDYDALAAEADQGAEEGQPGYEAGQQLQKIAFEAGMTEEEFGGTKDYAEVAEWIKAQAASTTEEAPPEPEPAIEFEPEKGAVYGLEVEVTDARTKKKVKRKIKVEVIAVYRKNKTVDCKNNTDKKTIYKGIKWDDLNVE